MIEGILFLSLGLLTFSIMAAIYRLVKGPTPPERIQALDALSIYMIAGVGIFSVFLRSTAFFEVILLLGILSFVATIALARYIERGVVIERQQSD
jgi:multicomponent Na+:H+ antiporter subunit F